MVIKKATHKKTSIFIMNWDTYQESETTEKPQKNHGETAIDTQSRMKRIIRIKKPFVQGSIELELASFLLEQIRRNKPDFKEPHLQVWGKELSLMILRDKREPGRIREVISWTQADSFWFKNILSPGKLRKQFDRIEIEMGKTPSSSKSEIGKGKDLAAARRREMEAKEAVPCPPDLRPDFMKETEK